MKKIIENWVHNPGRHCGSTALSDIMTYKHQNLSESMCFGLASGLGFFYIKLDTLNPTRLFHLRSRTLESDFFENIGVPFSWKMIPDADQALEIAKKSIDSDTPLLLQTDLSYLDYYNTSTHFPGHVVIMWGYDDEKGIAYLSDTERPGLQTTNYESLKKARSSKEGHLPLANNYFDVKDVSLTRPLEEAVRIALRKVAKKMLNQNGDDSFNDFFGIKVMKNLANDFPFWGEAKDFQWCARFGYQVIEKRGTGGGGFRFIYTDFLKDIEERFGEFKKHGLSKRMEDIANKWQNLAFLLKEISEKDDKSKLHAASEHLKEIIQHEENFYNFILKEIEM